MTQHNSQRRATVAKTIHVSWNRQRERLIQQAVQRTGIDNRSKVLELALKHLLTNYSATDGES